MITPEERDAPDTDMVVEQIVAEGPKGAIAVAGTATAIVILMWFLFYLLVFLPRSG